MMNEIEIAREIARAFASDDVDRKKLVGSVGDQLVKFPEPGGLFWQKESESAQRLIYEIKKAVGKSEGSGNSV